MEHKYTFASVAMPWHSPGKPFGLTQEEWIAKIEKDLKKDLRYMTFNEVNISDGIRPLELSDETP